MRLKIVAVDKLRDSSYRALTRDYLSRLEHYTNVEMLEVKSASRRASDAGEVKRIEGEDLLAAVEDEQIIVALDERGKSMTSKELASWLNDEMVGGTRSIAFIVGGANGLDRAVRKRARKVVSLSAMTMPHEMARMFLAEQLYRAMTILRGEPYHK